MMDQPKLVPLYSISSPAKAILCGEHAVVYGKDAIAIGIGLHCRGTLFKQPRTGDAARLTIASQMEPVQIINPKLMKFLQEKFAQLQKEQRYTFEKFEADLSTLEQTEKTSSPYERSTHFKLALLLQMHQIAWGAWQQQSSHDFILKVDSDIPIGRCLGSSAAYNTVLATALLIVFQQSPFSLTGELKELINDISMGFEAVEHGTPSGIDNYISVHGGVILYNRTREPRFTKLTHSAAHIKALMNVGVIDTCVDKNTKVAVANVRARCNADQKYRAMIDEIGAIVSKVAALIEDEQCNSNSIQQVLRLCSKNHELLRELGVSHPKIEEIVSEWEKKEWSGKVTGSGMGGCVLLLSHKSTPLAEGVVLASIDENGLQVSAIAPHDE